jgi:hypothetical protein
MSTARAYGIARGGRTAFAGNVLARDAGFRRFLRDRAGVRMHQTSSDGSCGSPRSVTRAVGTTDEGSTMLAAGLGGIGIVGIVVLVLIVLAVLAFMRRA